MKRDNETLGTPGGVLLMWLWLSVYVILLGAARNGEIEAQTAIGSTTGPKKPMGNARKGRSASLGSG